MRLSKFSYCIVLPDIFFYKVPVVHFSIELSFSKFLHLEAFFIYSQGELSVSYMGCKYFLPLDGLSFHSLKGVFKRSL